MSGWDSGIDGPGNFPEWCMDLPANKKKQTSRGQRLTAEDASGSTFTAEAQLPPDLLQILQSLTAL